MRGAGLYLFQVEWSGADQTGGVVGEMAWSPGLEPAVSGTSGLYGSQLGRGDREERVSDCGCVSVSV